MASISLAKGSNISLTKVAPSLSTVLVGLGWDVNAFAGGDVDLDAAALMLGANGKVRSDADFIFYNQLASTCGSVTHLGDNLTGAGDGDDEEVVVILNQVPADVETIRIAVTIHTVGANFGQVRNAFVRLVNNETNEEIVRYDLSEDYSIENAMVFAELYRHGGEWKFRAVGQGYADGLAGVARDAGVSIA